MHPESCSAAGDGDRDRTISSWVKMTGLEITGKSTITSAGSGKQKIYE